jgi:O-antigen/teichoic acid export membrane protein
LFPAIVNAKKVSSELYYQRLQKMYDFMVVFSIALTIPMFFLNSSIINILYGSQYNQSAGVLLILFCSTLSVSIGVSNGLWLLNENLQRINVINKTLGMLLNIILNLLLIPKFGIKGSAYATLISYFVTNYFILLLFKNTRPSFINISKSLNLYRVYTRNFR